jgi:hypothetical protein
MVSKRRPFSFNFIFRNRKKSQGAKSGEYVVLGMTAIWFFARNWWVKTEVQTGRCHGEGCDMVHSQLFRKNPFACPITNSHLLSNVVNGPTSILTDGLLNSRNSFRICAGSAPPCVFVIVN